ncbi:MAG: ASC-1-like (ASCH) protein [Candidatus Latescibacterota bacterium]
MIIWTLVALLMVVGVKYYTSLEMRKLERRLETVKNGLQQVKERLHDAQMRQKEVQSEESNFGDRMQTMKEIINDLQFRMSNSDDLAEKSIADSMPPTGF